MPIQSVKGVSCVDLLSSAPNITNAPLVVTNPPVGSRLHEFWEKWAALGIGPKVISVLKEGYILPFRSRPYLTRKPRITSCYVDPRRNSYLLEALHLLLDKNAQNWFKIHSPWVFTTGCSLYQNPTTGAPYLGSELTEQFFENTVFQNGDPRNNTNLPPSRGVGHLHRIQRRILPHTHKQPVQEVHVFSHPKQNLPIQSTALWPFHSSYGVHCHSQGGKMDSNEKGYKDPPVP